VALGSDYKHRLANTRVFKCNNGWYAIALGPYEPAAAVEMRDRLVSSGDIPKDSLVTESVTYQQLVWGDDDTTGSIPSNSNSGMALEAATNFFRTSNRSNREGLSFLDRVYPAQVMYFGKRASKAYVMAEKQAFLERWPQRAYSMRPGTVSTSCDTQDKLLHGDRHSRLAGYECGEKRNFFGVGEISVDLRAPRLGAHVAL
jgi:hypothetical protein